MKMNMLLKVEAAIFSESPNFGSDSPVDPKFEQTGLILNIFEVLVCTKVAVLVFCLELSKCVLSSVCFQDN